jgi:uncharacterized protein (UPF0332 family)
MDGTAFLEVAEILIAGETEAEWRSAVSRAYYAAYHVGRTLLLECGFPVTGADSHGYVIRRLSNAQFPEVVDAGSALGHLRGYRNRADYDLNKPFEYEQAAELVGLAADALNIFQITVKEPSVIAKITDAIKIYERDVLRQVSWIA